MQLKRYSLGQSNHRKCKKTKSASVKIILYLSLIRHFKVVPDPLALHVVEK